MKNQSKPYNPAQEGIDAARADARKKLVAERMIEEFKAFVLDSMSDGTVCNLDDVTTERQILALVKDAMELYANLAEPHLEG